MPLEYRSALVPIFGEDVSAAALESAARFVGRDATVDAVYVINVPSQIPLDGPLDRRGGARAQRARGRSADRQARRTARPHEPAANPQPGRTLVEEAQRLGSEIIYLADAHAPASERALGPTAQYLLTQRPCRIIIQTGAAANGRAAVNGGGDGRALRPSATTAT